MRSFVDELDQERFERLAATVAHWDLGKLEGELLPEIPLGGGLLPSPCFAPERCKLLDRCRCHDLLRG